MHKWPLCARLAAASPSLPVHIPLAWVLCGSRMQLKSATNHTSNSKSQGRCDLTPRQAGPRGCIPRCSSTHAHTPPLAFASKLRLRLASQQQNARRLLLPTTGKGKQ